MNRTREVIAADLAGTERKINVLRYELANYGKNDVPVTAKLRYLPEWLSYALIVEAPDGSELRFLPRE